MLLVMIFLLANKIRDLLRLYDSRGSKFKRMRSVSPIDGDSDLQF